ncbi:MAG: Mrp/NBP35 family ATP-binding protein [bacterium]|nr:Mrp/NBP35 family ATP-binding protein [bacterium]
MTDLNQQVMTALSTVIEPELHRDIVSLNMVRDLSIEGGTAHFTIVLTTPACPLKDVFVSLCNEAVIGKVPGIQQLQIKWDAQVPTDSRMGRMNAPMRSIIAVGSGKGGVGKSTVSVNLAVALAEAGARVGLIDADILNPNVPQMMGLTAGRPKVVNNKMMPIEAYGVKIMSTGFLIDPEKPMIMRGPMLHSAIRQFFTDVDWGSDLDYMIVDLPPGTGDAPLSLAQSFPLAGAIVVTQPQEVAVADALRSIAMFDQLNVPVLGVVENMAGDFFGTGGGETLAAQRSVPFLGRVPLEAEVRKGGDYGRPIVAVQPESPAGQAFQVVSRAVAARVSVVMLQNADVIPLTVIG